MRVKLQIGNEESTKDYKRVFVLSDIHNHYESYCEMRDKLNWDKGDLVIIDGDIVDRGGEEANPLGLLSEVRFEENRKYDVIMLRGNHEDWLAASIGENCPDSKRVYHYNSLEILVQQLDLDIDELWGYAEWMATLPLWMKMEIEGYPYSFAIAHASTHNPESEDECLMGVPNVRSILADEGKVVHIVGHMCTFRARYYYDENFDGRNRYNTDILRCLDDRLWFIDCGNGYRDEKDFPGKLGCIELPGNGEVVEHYA